MVSELIHKRRNRAGMICIIIFAISFLFSGCDPKSSQYPFQKAAKWESDDPVLSLCYYQQEDGTWLFSEELQLDGKLIEIDLAMSSNYYCAYPVYSNHHDDRLFSGIWKYRNGNLVLIVEEDFIFDGKYSKIILKPIAEKSTP